MLLAAAVLALPAVAGLFVWLQVPRPGMTKANYERIRLGMTLAEVEGILGGPAGDYSRRCTAERFPALVGGDGGDVVNLPDGTWKCWRSDEGEVGVLLTPDEHVAWKEAQEYVPAPFLDRLRRLLPW
jgi:hypothetical protein